MKKIIIAIVSILMFLCSLVACHACMHDFILQQVELYGCPNSKRTAKLQMKKRKYLG